jgi:hypothetical protein
MWRSDTNLYHSQRRTAWSGGLISRYGGNNKE